MRKVNRLYTNQQRQLAEQQKEIYDLHKQISYYSCKVAALEGEKTEAIERRFAQLEERLDQQNDLVSDLRDEVAILRGKVCRCHEVRIARVLFLDNNSRALRRTRDVSLPRKWGIWSTRIER